MPKEVILFKALVKLNCHYNAIRWLPEELHLLTNLKEIDFRYVDCVREGEGVTSNKGDIQVFEEIVQVS